MKRSYKIAILYLFLVLILVVGCLIYWIVNIPYFDTVLSVVLIISILCFSIIMVCYGIQNIITLWKRENLASLIPLIISVPFFILIIFIISITCLIPVDIFFGANYVSLEKKVKTIENLDLPCEYFSDEYKFVANYWVFSQHNDIWVYKNGGLLEVTFFLKIGLFREIISYISNDKPRIYKRNIDGHPPKYIRIKPKWYRLVY